MMDPAFFYDEWGNVYVYQTFASNRTVWPDVSGCSYTVPEIDVNDLTPAEFWDIYGPPQ